MSKKLSRRDFLKLAGATSAGLAFSACGVKPTEQPTATYSPPTATLTLTTTPKPTATFTSTPIPPLPILYVDGPYIKRGDTEQPVWLKGLAIFNLAGARPYSFKDLLYLQGLYRVVTEKWGVNLLTFYIDSENAKVRLPEINRLLKYAEENRMYCIITCVPSIYNPLRDNRHLPIPDNEIVEVMGDLADALKERTNIIYGLWAEPHPEDLNSDYGAAWQLWMDAGTKVAEAIRAKDPKAILDVPGGRLWARDLSYYQVHPFPFENVIYDVHDYWQPPGNPSYDRTMWTWMIGKYPLLVGEFGGACCEWSNPPLQSDHDINYMKEVLQIVNSNPELVHYAMWELESQNEMGIFTKDFELTRRGQLLVEDLKEYPSTQFR